MHKAAGRHKGSASFHQAHGLDCYVERQTGRDVTPRSTLQSAHDVVQIIDIGHNNDRDFRCNGFKEFELGDAGFVAVVDDDYDNGGSKCVRLF